MVCSHMGPASSPQRLTKSQDREQRKIERRVESEQIVGDLERVVNSGPSVTIVPR